MLVLGSSALAGSYGSSVVDYTPGTGATGFTTTSAALGVPEGDTSFGANTPFNPPFLSSQLLKVGGGGSLTMQLNQPIAVVPGASIGLFSNNGLWDMDPATTFDPITFECTAGGRGLAGSPPNLFSNPGTANVSVSADGIAWKTVSGGAITFANPTNAYSDAIVNLSYGSGTTLADPFKPFTKSVTDLSGLWFRDVNQPSDIVRVLNGSAGGTWVDVSGVPLSLINYVKFDVPSDSRLVVDAVTAVPEPTCLGLLGVGAIALIRRRKNG